MRPPMHNPREVPLPAKLMRPHPVALLQASAQLRRDGASMVKRLAPALWESRKPAKSISARGLAAPTARSNGFTLAGSCRTCGGDTALARLRRP